MAPEAAGGPRASCSRLHAQRPHAPRVVVCSFSNDASCFAAWRAATLARLCRRSRFVAGASHRREGSNAPAPFMSAAVPSDRGSSGPSSRTGISTNCFGPRTPPVAGERAQGRCALPGTQSHAWSGRSPPPQRRRCSFLVAPWWRHAFGGAGPTLWSGDSCLLVRPATVPREHVTRRSATINDLKWCVLPGIR